MDTKYHLCCTACGCAIDDFGQWFAQGQKCVCGCPRAEVRYHADYSKLSLLCSEEGGGHCSGEDGGLFRYFDFLPLNHRSSVVSFGEATVPMERWDFLARFALEKYGIRCTPVVTRSDLSGGTGTFKDPAAALGASLFREYGIREYCMASTGNSATAFSRYLAEAGIRFKVFLPADACPDTVAAIRSHGQEAIVVDGGYGAAKEAAAAYSAASGTLMTAGNIDPVRVESKRTLVFEYLRQLGRMPDVYVQAVAGGTAPIALDKGIRELEEECGGEVNVAGKKATVRMPRLILAQQDTCDPMVRSWEQAVSQDFPDNWEQSYVSVVPTTKISILTAAKPGNYPIVAPLVRRSGGAFVRVKESELVDLARTVLSEKGFIPGPASMVCIAGFLQALSEGLIRQDDLVSLNMGEGSARASCFRHQVECCAPCAFTDYLFQ